MFLYKLVLSFHIIAVICWMAGLLYLIRLFVYHRMETENVVKARFKVMESKLYKYITTPAMIIAFILGASLLMMNMELLKQPWMHAKLLLVFLMIGVTHMCGATLRKFANDETPKTERFYRIFNEVPTLLMIAIVLLVIMRPFQH